jgi:hypothetical protein
MHGDQVIPARSKYEELADRSAAEGSETVHATTSSSQDVLHDVYYSYRIMCGTASVAVALLMSIARQ